MCHILAKLDLCEDTAELTCHNKYPTLTLTDIFIIRRMEWGRACGMHGID
jgi:hypothetical protein